MAMVAPISLSRSPSLGSRSNRRKIYALVLG